MDSDKQIWWIFELKPEWLYELCWDRSPGHCEFRAFVMKALERRADGLLVPDDPGEPLIVFEFQFQFDAQIYSRIVTEMAAAQSAHEMRPVIGVIIFGSRGLDPQTVPWTLTVQRFELPALLEAFEKRHPDHPLIAAFKPLMIDDRDELARQATVFCRQIRTSTLVEEDIKSRLLDVFLDWMKQRFSTLGYEEFRAMFFTEFQDLTETRLGKDLIAIGEKRGELRGEKRGVKRGEKRGEARGLIRAVLTVLETRHGVLDDALRVEIERLAATEATSLLAHVTRDGSLESVRKWLAASAAEDRI